MADAAADADCLPVLVLVVLSAAVVASVAEAAAARSSSAGLFPCATPQLIDDDASAPALGEAELPAEEVAEEELEPHPGGVPSADG